MVALGSTPPTPLFIVGAQRSGTSFLANSLAQLGGVERLKAPQGEPRIWLGREPVRHFNRPARTERGRITHLLEKSTSYLEYPKVAYEIGKHLPNAHVIISLRNPMSRALSHYYFTKRNGLETLSLRKALAMDHASASRAYPATISVSPYSYLRRGCYENYLQPWINTFQPAQLHILLFEDMTRPDWEADLFLRRLGFSEQTSASFRASSDQNRGNVSQSRDEDLALVSNYRAFFAQTFAFVKSLGLPVHLWDDLP